LIEFHGLLTECDLLQVNHTVKVKDRPAIENYCISLILRLTDLKVDRPKNLDDVFYRLADNFKVRVRIPVKTATESD